VGEVLAGKYRIERVLGAGGMGMVVLAHHVRLDQRVAIKFLLPEMLDNGDAVARFEREARAAVKIRSEHVARVSDVGTLESGAPYMVMEYLEGADLSVWLKQRGPLPLEQAVEFLLQASEAIAEAHVLGIVHRDLKPANLFVTRLPDGALSVKVLDFGISKMRSNSSSVPDVSITKTATMMGSPLYMSPEQLQSSKDADQRADIWALGIILQELLTGSSPFIADTVPELVAKILSMPPPALRSVRSDIPEGLERAILKCLEKDRNRRFSSVGELARALAPFAPRRSQLSLDRIAGLTTGTGGTGVDTVTAIGASPAFHAWPPTQTQGSFGATRAPGHGKKLTWLVAILATGVLVGGYFVIARPLPPSADGAPRQTPSAPATGAPAASPVLAPEPPPAFVADAPAVTPEVRTVPSPVANDTSTPAAPGLEPRRSTPLSGAKHRVKPSAAAAGTAAPHPVTPPVPPEPKAAVPDAFDERK
jgi:serine/threonine-protein kinase